MVLVFAVFAIERSAFSSLGAPLLGGGFCAGGFSPGGFSPGGFSLGARTGTLAVAALFDGAGSCVLLVTLALFTIVDAAGAATRVVTTICRLPTAGSEPSGQVTAPFA